MKDNNRYRVACFGEVLWDIFPSEEKPGGAPMNVGYHLKVFQTSSALITRVGRDVRGERLISMFSDKDMCTDYFQFDEKLATGEVIVHQNERKELTYDIVLPSAWDFITPEPSFEKLVAGADYFVFGTLAARSKTSRETLFGLLEVANKKFLDVNLRAPHYSLPLVEELLHRSDYVKMNGEELEILTDVKNSSIANKTARLRDKYNLSLVLVTLGSEGAALLMGDEFVEHRGFKVEVEDTVGSGDAFLGGFLSKMISGGSNQEALEFACGAGAYVATQKGACPEYEVEQVCSLIQSARN